MRPCVDCAAASLYEHLITLDYYFFVVTMRTSAVFSQENYDFYQYAHSSASVHLFAAVSFNLRKRIHQVCKLPNIAHVGVIHD